MRTLLVHAVVVVEGVIVDAGPVHARARRVIRLTVGVRADAGVIAIARSKLTGSIGWTAEVVAND